MDTVMERRQTPRVEEIIADDVITRAVIAYGSMTDIPKGDYLILAISADQVMRERDQLLLLLSELKEAFEQGHKRPQAAITKINTLLSHTPTDLQHKVASDALRRASTTLFNGDGFVGRSTVRHVLHQEALKEKYL